MVIRYEMVEIKPGVEYSNTKCPNGNPCLVASEVCTEWCKYYNGSDPEPNTIDCGYNTPTTAPTGEEGRE
jgi:hypothetical protein